MNVVLKLTKISVMKIKSMKYVSVIYIVFVSIPLKTNSAGAVNDVMMARKTIKRSHVSFPFERSEKIGMQLSSSRWSNCLRFNLTFSSFLSSSKSKLHSC